jgi:MoaA/NifB/PqqE/SkfB family radical SAM enzyme
MTYPEGNMSLGCFTKIVRQLSGYPGEIYLHWRGEPLLHPQIEDIFTIIHEIKPLRLILFTNLTVKWELLLENLKSFHAIYVSIDSYHHEARNWAIYKERLRELSAKSGNTLLYGHSIIDFADTKSSFDISSELRPYFNELFFREPVETLVERPISNLSKCSYSFPQSLFISWDGVIHPCCMCLNGEFSMARVDQAELADIWQKFQNDPMFCHGPYIICSKCGLSTLTVPGNFGTYRNG